jgi:thioredoxin-like negative regulator of GroEL
MFRLRALLGLTVLMLAAPLAAQANSSAADLFAQGQALLGKGDFDAALKAFAAAARQDSQNQAYRDRYALVRRIGKMRETIAKEQNPQKWQETALALHTFYYDNGLYSEALPLDEHIHAKLNTASSARMLGRTKLELGQAAEAAAVLDSLPSDARTPETEALRGLALARAGQLDAARQLAEQLGVPDKGDPNQFYDLARLNALVGRSQEAATALTRTFEFTAPSRLDGVKSAARASKDLEGLLADQAYAGVLATASKVKESSCTGGSSCGSCASAGSCSKSGASAHAAHGEKKP